MKDQSMKKLILIPAISMHLMAGGNTDFTPTTNTDSIGTQERTYFEIAMGKPIKPLTEDELRNRVIYTNIIGAGIIAAWGTAFWDYFTIQPVLGDEGWFEKDKFYNRSNWYGGGYYHTIRAVQI